jgi:hypothetical protein
VSWLWHQHDQERGLQQDDLQQLPPAVVLEVL